MQNPNISQNWGDQIKFFLSSRVKKLETQKSISILIALSDWGETRVGYEPTDGLSRINQPDGVARLPDP